MPSTLFEYIDSCRSNQNFHYCIPSVSSQHNRTIAEDMADQLVYIQHSEYSWVPALLMKQTSKSATVSIAKYTDESEIGGVFDPNKGRESVTVKLKDYVNGSLPLQNTDGGRIKERADMTKLDFLHEVNVPRRKYALL